MKAIVTKDVETMWGAQLKAGTEVQLDPVTPIYGQKIYRINKPDQFNDCFIGPEFLDFSEGGNDQC